MCLVCRVVTAIVGFMLLVVAMAYAIKQARADEAHDWHTTKFFILEQPELLAKEVIEFFLVDVGLGSGSPKL